MKKRLIIWVAAVSIASSACKEEGPTAPAVQVNRLQLQFSGADAGALETAGMPVFPTDFTKDFVLLGRGRVNGVDITHQVLAVNSETAYATAGFDDFLMFLNPSITQPGHYGPDDCPQPAAVDGCIVVNIRFGVPPEGGSGAILMTAVRDSVSITVEQITPDTLRASFEGTFTFNRGIGHPVLRVQVSQGSVFAVRTGPSTSP